jgi:hypothetical protein
MPFTQRLYGHPHHISTEELHLVPWLKISSNNRRKIVSEEPIGFERTDEKIVNKRLQALGYTED